MYRVGWEGTRASGGLRLVPPSFTVVDVSVRFGFGMLVSLLSFDFDFDFIFVSVLVLVSIGSRIVNSLDGFILVVVDVGVSGSHDDIDGNDV